MYCNLHFVDRKKKIPQPEMNSTANMSTCIVAGGTIVMNGVCSCPSGFSSTYDAFSTGLYCTVPVEYIPSNTDNSSSSDSQESSYDASITTSGIIQLVVVFSLSMLVVCLIRKIWPCSTRDDSYSYPVPWSTPPGFISN